MDHIALGDGDFAVDLESGRTSSDEDGSIKGEEGLTLGVNVLNSGGVLVDNVKVLIDKKLGNEETLDMMEKKIAKEKPKKTSNKKPPRPPRPPRGPSLDAADQKLIKEITELAMLKRARIERKKALKKMKASKASSSSNSNLFALVFTIFFCIVILFQAMFSRGSSPVSFQGSTVSTAGSEGSLMSVQLHRNFSTSDTSGPRSGTSSLVEQVTRLDPKDKVNRVRD